VNFGGPDLTLPLGAQVLLTSGAMSGGGAVPSDTTVWLRGT